MQPRCADEQRHTHHEIEVGLLLPLPMLTKVIPVVSVENHNGFVANTAVCQHLQQCTNLLVHVAHACVVSPPLVPCHPVWHCGIWSVREPAAVCECDVELL